MMGDTKTTFNIRNYTKPNTPKNILRICELIQGILLGVSTLTIAANTEHWISISLNIAIVVANRVVMFFGSIEKDLQTESATAVFPSGGEVTVSQDVPNKPLDSGEQEI